MMLSVNLAQWRYVEELQSSKLNEHRARRLSSKLGASPTNYVKKTATTCCFSRVMPTDSIISSHAQQHPWDGERKRKAQLFHYFPPEDTEQQANKRVRVTQREVIHFRSSLKELGRRSSYRRRLIKRQYTYYHGVTKAYLRRWTSPK